VPAKPAATAAGAPGRDGPDGAGGANNDDDIIDTVMLDQLRQFYGDEFGRFFELFVSEVRTQLRRIGRLAAAADAKMLSREAHSLAGSAATFGCRSLTRHAIALEAAARQGDRAAFTAGATAATAAFHRARAALAIRLAAPG
jgi:HPt (histidine-containing phosphotransfer) domain-containing protein